MYKIYYYYSDDYKRLYMHCTNKRKKPHDTDLWRKIEDRAYICNDCGCRMKIYPQVKIEEEEIIE
jgi:hypothetical protein